MIYINLRSGNFGCGVVGDNLSRALGAITSVHRLGKGPRLPEPLRGPLLERLDQPKRTYTASRYVAYCVFEDDLRVRRRAIRAHNLFDVIAPASRWCEQALREGGLTNVVTIHQGVDGSLFNPRRAVRRRWPDRFVVFTGGKFELRKGQDVVVKAFRIFAERHHDAVLVASWQQPWTKHALTMTASTHAPFVPCYRECPREALLRWLSSAGVDLRQVELVPPLSNVEMAGIYGDTDVGLFPSRCEGATNLVMMEYMACGRPVVATDFSGHRDILNEANSLRLQSWRLLSIVREGETVGCWCEPDIDETVACLEQLYDDRARAKAIGRRAAMDLTHWTWERAAREFLELLEVDS